MHHVVDVQWLLLRQRSKSRHLLFRQIEVGLDGALNESSQVFVEELDGYLLTFDVDLETARACGAVDAHGLTALGEGKPVLAAFNERLAQDLDIAIDPGIP